MEQIRNFIKPQNITEFAIDSHAHLGELEDIEKIVENMQSDGLQNIINMCGSIQGAKIAQKLSKEHSNIYYMLGLHPYDIEQYNDEYINFITNLAKTDDHMVGVGEIGLDYHGEHLPEDMQKDIFKKQIILANKLNKPISIHIRDAHLDAIEILNNSKEFIKNSGIIHCFCGTADDVQKYLNLGFYISISGNITFKKKSETETELERVVKLIPLDRLLIETDSPFLCPVPYRGTKNQPKYVIVTAQAIADLKHMDVNELIKITRENAERLLIKKFK